MVEATQLVGFLPALQAWLESLAAGSCLGLGLTIVSTEAVVRALSSLCLSAF